MTPKEKAQELVFKKFGCSKRYALLAVDEILQTNNNEDFYFDKSIGYYLSCIEYFEEVKQEIEKL